MFNLRYADLFEAFIRNPNMTQQQMKDLLAEQAETKRDKLIDFKVRVEALTLKIHKDPFVSATSTYPLFELTS